MPDTKITALTAIGANPIIPATFPIPMVDLTDTSMAASGTTKKVTVNQILGAGGTATLASATITGDLTAARLNVTGATIPANGVYLGSANNLSFSAASTLGMTLNSSGLGVGGSPTNRFEVFSGFIKNTATTGSAQIIAGNTGGVFTLAKDSSTGGNFTGTAYASVLYSDGAYPVCIFSNGSERLRIDSSGNVGVGVTPSTAWNTAGNLQIGIFAGLYTNSSLGAVDLTSNSIRTGSDTYQYLSASSNAASRFQQRDGSFRWFNAIAGTSPNAITFTQAMTLTASGDLGVGITNPSFRLHALVSSGADRDIFAAQVLAASNGLQVKWNHATTTLRIILANIPTSSAGLATGTLWNDAGTIKIA